MIQDLPLSPLTADAFAPYGELVEYGTITERRALIDVLATGQKGARPHLDFTIAPAQALPVTGVVMERHVHSSQSFVPLDVARYLVVVAPHGPDGGPDMAQARAFAARGDQSVTYRADVWHHPLTALDRDGLFALLTWRAGTDADTEFRSLSTPVRLGAP